MRTLLAILAVSGLLATAGCFKSSTSQASSESSSNSSGWSSNSSSNSSSPERRYRGEVAETTQAWTLSGGDAAVLQRDISRLAKDAGISDWESRESTWVGVGRGLKRAGVKGTRFEELKREIGGSDQEHLKWIASGYKSE